jgi:hypothetical protein
MGSRGGIVEYTLRDGSCSDTLDEPIRSHAGALIRVGSTARVGPITLVARQVTEGRVETVDLTVAPET